MCVGHDAGGSLLWEGLIKCSLQMNSLRRSLQGPMGNFVSTRLATDAQVKQFLGVCEGFLVSSALERVVSVTQVPPQCGWASPGRCLLRAGPPQGGWSSSIHWRVWIEQKVEEGGVCSSSPKPSRCWCHPPLSPVLRPLDGVTHTACFLVPSLRQQLLGLLSLRHHRSQAS